MSVKPHKCDGTERPYVVNCHQCNTFTPTTMTYSKAAKLYSHLQDNNSAFRGRNLSDNSAVTKFNRKTASHAQAKIRN